MQEIAMANIVIQDLDDSAELDQEAMRKITGGRSSLPGLGLQQARPQTLLDRRSIEGDAVLPKIGLGAGFLGGKDVL
jgi:hypothetical protein